MVASWTGPAGRACTTCSHKTATASPWCRTRPCRWPVTPQPPILPPTDGFLFLDRDKIHDSFAGDVPAGQAAFMADSQVPWGLDALGGTITEPAWRARPSWYLLTTEDRMIPPPAQQMMSERAGSTVEEVAASHSVYVSQ